MLELILSKDWTNGRDEVLRLIAEDVKACRSGRILMVPELISHDTERRLCECAGDTASRFAEVLSFTRLARRVADSVGFAARECLDNGGRVVAMAAAARQLHSRLKAYASVETRPEFLTGLVDAVDEFKRCCISAPDLKAAASRTDGALAQKLEELSLLLESYDSLCQRGKRDPRDQMTWLLEQMEESDFAQNHVFYIDGFPDFTRQHMAILEHLIVHAPQVTVSMNCDAVGSCAMAFEKAGETARALIQCAKAQGVEVKIRTLTAPTGALDAVKERLFQGSTEPVPGLSDRLFLRRADSVYTECLGAARRIMELVHGGNRYRDIGVVCTDMNAYSDTVHLVFERSGIPVYQSGTEDVLDKTVVTTVLSAMDAALGGFERQDVMRYLRSALSPLDPDTCDLLENYAVLWGINYGKWERPWENHPDGLGCDWNEDSRSRLQSLNDARTVALEPLLRLRRGFLEAKDLAGQVSCLCAFFEDISLSQRLSNFAERLDAAGDNRSAQILDQLWEILLSALEQMHAVLGETVWDLSSFTRLFTLLLSQYDVGTIPPVLDSVTVGPISAMRCHQVKHLIVLGAQEGQLPSYGGSTGVLSEQERAALRELGVPLTGGGMEGLQAQFAEIYGVFCGAEETVWVSCGPGQPSYVYRRLASMAGGDAPIEAGAENTMSDPVEAAARLVRFRDEESADKLGIRQAYDAVAGQCSYTLGRVSADGIRGLYGKQLRLSASQVDRQAECRLSYFLCYGLRARERKEANVDPAEFGTYVHAVLEKTAKRVMELGGFHQVSLEDTVALAMEYSQTYAEERFSQLDSQRMVYLFQKNIQELRLVVKELWEELSTAEFAPVDFEVQFGDEAEMPAIPIPGGNMDAQLRGFVDRVDKWNDGYNDYFRVVDYKTGAKDFDYCDVFNGIGLQMLLYLFALEQGGQSLLGENPIPVGVQYFPARMPHISAKSLPDAEELEKERRKGMKRRGLVLADEHVLRAMEPEGSPSRLSCRWLKDGTLTGDVMDREQVKLLKRYVMKILRRLVDEIASGKVDPNPYTRGNTGACSFCPYKPICHHTCVADRRNYKAMSAERFWEEVGKECNGNGR